MKMNLFWGDVTMVRVMTNQVYYSRAIINFRYAVIGVCCFSRCFGKVTPTVGYFIMNNNIYRIKSSLADDHEVLKLQAPEPGPAVLWGGVHHAHQHVQRRVPRARKARVSENMLLDMVYDVSFDMFFNMLFDFEA